MGLLGRLISAGRRPYLMATTAVKGGTGKTTFTTSIVRKLSGLGKDVILIDCDIEGSNCPRALGVRDKMLTAGKDLEPVQVNDHLWLYSIELHPCTRPGMPIVLLGESHRLFIKECVQAAIRRKPDFIVLDFPAGHGDSLHTLMNVVGRLDGALIVSGPTRISTDNCENAVLACGELKIPILGVVENFSSFTCDGCQKVHHPLGHGAASEMAKKFGLEFLGEQAIDPAIPVNEDLGVRVFNNPIVDRVVKKILGD